MTEEAKVVKPTATNQLARWLAKRDGYGWQDPPSRQAADVQRLYEQEASLLLQQVDQWRVG
jgi:hypothetical protein